MREINIYAAPYGDDCADGTAESPLRTVNGVIHRLRSFRGMAEHITVRFRAGTYFIADTIRFTSEDLTGVTFRSYEGERAVFTGAREIKCFVRTAVNGVPAFVADYPVRDENDYFNALYNGNMRLRRAIYPKKGELSVCDVSDSDAFTPENSMFKLHAAFFAQPTDVRSFKNLTDVDVRILHYWNDELLPVAAVDTRTGRIETSKPASMTVSKGDRFLFENVYEALSEPGEWYLDRTEGKLLYIPFEGETPENTVLYAGVTEQLMTFDSCRNIDFSGIDFCRTGWRIGNGKHFCDYMQGSDNPLFGKIKFAPDFPQACYDSPCAVTVENSENIRFTDCTFLLSGSSALQFGIGSKNCGVKSSLFDDIGGNAVYIKGVNKKDSDGCTFGISVIDCHIKTYGRVFNNAIGVLLVHACNCEISHNEIHDGLYTAISAGWIWGYGENITDGIIIADNLIYDIGQGWLSDMGGIYMLGIQPHSVIRNNVTHDVGCYAGTSGYGGWGIYLDEGSSNILVENNLVYHCSSEGFHQHYGQDNMIRNNIFALNTEAQLRVSRKEDHNSLFLYNNILVGNNSPIYYDIVEGKFTDKGNIYWDYTRGENVVSCTDDDRSVPEVREAGYYKRAVFTDPMFTDPGSCDFTFLEGSRVREHGFIPFDSSHAGTKTVFPQKVSL